jgi:hypothetical protein
VLQSRELSALIQLTGAVRKHSGATDIWGKQSLTHVPRRRFYILSLGGQVPLEHVHLENSLCITLSERGFPSLRQAAFA